MARFAACRSAISSHLLHSIFELSFVRIRVASGTGAIFKSVKRRVFRLGRRFRLVAITTGHCDVASGQHKPGLLVLRLGEGGGPISI